MVVSSPQSWKMVMTQQLMSPTCPITIWFHLRRTFWTEPLHWAFSASILDCMSSCYLLCAPKGQSCCSAWASEGPEVQQAWVSRKRRRYKGSWWPQAAQRAFYLHSACLFWDTLFLQTMLPLVSAGLGSIPLGHVALTRHFSLVVCQRHKAFQEDFW